MSGNVPERDPVTEQEGRWVSQPSHARCKQIRHDNVH